MLKSKSLSSILSPMQKQTTSLEQTISHKRGISEISIRVVTNAPIDGSTPTDAALSLAIDSAVDIIGKTFEPLDLVEVEIEPDSKKAKTGSEAIPEPTPVPITEPAIPAIPPIRKLLKSDYPLILKGPEDAILTYNSFSVDLLDGSDETKPIRDHLWKSAKFPKVDSILKHIALHVEIKTDADCEILLKGFSKCYVKDRFIMLLTTVTSHSELMKTFIKKGMNSETVEVLMKTSCASIFHNLLDAMGFMSEKLNLDVFKLFLAINQDKSYVVKIIRNAKALINPLTTENMRLVNKMTKLVSLSLYFSTSTKNELLALICK